MPTQTEITCPLSYIATTTKVKVESDGTHYRTVPFVEIYNGSSETQFKDLVFEGFVTGTAAALSDINKTLTLEYYLILYDATFTSSSGNITCAEYNCEKHGNRPYYCENAIYIGYGMVLIVIVHLMCHLAMVIGLYQFRTDGILLRSNWNISCNVYGSTGNGPINNCSEIGTDTL